MAKVVLMRAAGAAILVSGSGEGDGDCFDDTWILHLGPEDARGLVDGQVAWQRLPCR